MSRTIFRLVAVATTITAVTLPAAQAVAAPANTSIPTCAEPGPGQDFAERSPAELGFGPGLTAALDAVHAQRPQNVTINVYRNGCRVYSTGPQTNAIATQSFSVAKSVSAMGVARAIQLGALTLDSTVGQFVPQADPAHAAVTVRDLLTMTGGEAYDVTRDYGTVYVDNLDDWLSRPIVHAPGTYYQYDQSLPAVLNRLVARAVGTPFRDFVRTELFEPLGIGDDEWKWLPSSDGDVAGYWNLYTTAPVYARLGELMRLGGAWNGRQLLAPAFMAAVARSSPANGHYGLMFWTNAGDWGVTPMTFQDRRIIHGPMVPGAPGTLYGMWGILGQRVMIDPATGIVIQASGDELFGRRDPIDAVLNLWDGEVRLDWELTQAVFTNTVDPQPLPPTPYPGELPHGWRTDQGLLHTLFHPEQLLGITDPTREILEWLQGGR
ncbi:beta-lactamase family protein [Nocardia sp. CDC159]|uniref:Beta-lactamase family protein n=1 Tax=Nocardia pulmonis TaxID=2951408 RepID=A0A9X2IZI2_9NOCA|nr:MULTISPECIES: serine hydrolase domain-containing protein [Nocardia]MCM6778102.1 beta-lactamase family protein [Nocardia pulmonis]MCM6790991.1 beta-lactamase family protein [Nocardia sp. CDC159]